MLAGRPGVETGLELCQNQAEQMFKIEVGKQDDQDGQCADSEQGKGISDAAGHDNLLQG